MTEADFLRAICDDPLDDAVRLVYADWLNDQGMHAKEDDLRREVRLNRMLKFQLSKEIMQGYKPLQDNRVELFKDLWGKGVRAGWFRRGYLDSVTLDFEAWLQHGPDICRDHPLSGVQCYIGNLLAGGCWSTIDLIKGRKPIYVWDCNGVARVITTHPGTDVSPFYERRYSFIEHLRYKLSQKEYPSENEAIEALLRVCLDWARDVVGLPEMKRQDVTPSPLSST